MYGFRIYDRPKWAPADIVEAFRRLPVANVSDCMSRHPKIEARLAGMSSSDRIITCTIVRGEILFGIERLPQGKRRSDLAAKASATMS